MEPQDFIDLVANLLAIGMMAVKAYKKAKPRLGWAARHVVAFATAHWRKAVIALTAAWAAGGVLAYGLTGGMDDTAPLWAMCWLGSVSLALWGCAAWQGGLAARWAVRQTRRLVA